MLWIYAGIDILKAFKTAQSELPEKYIDLSKISAEELSKSVGDVCDHHASGHIFLGFLDPLLMLHPTEETKLRKGFLKFDVSVVVSNPLILPLSWKNGTSRLRMIEGSHHARHAEIIDNGGTPLIQHETGHGSAPTQTTDKRDTDKGRKKRSTAPRRKQKGQDQTTKS